MAVRINAGVELNDVGRLIVDVVGLAPNAAELYVTSGMDGDHGTVSHHYGNLSYNGSPTAAVDVGGGGVTTEGSRRMRDFARWVYTTFPADVVELIHTTPYSDDQGFYIRRGVKYPGGTGWLDAATMAAHLNHVHLAMSQAGALAVLARLAVSAPKGGSSVALFIDVSYHDWDRRGGALDWAAIAAAGLGGVMCARATYGDPQVFNPPSPHFGDYMAGAKAAGFTARGAYHNLVRGDAASVARQVDLLRSTMDRYGGEWAMADVEAYPELVTRNLVPDWGTVQRFHDRWYAVEPRVMAWYIAEWMWAGKLGSPSLAGLRGPLINANYKGGDGTPKQIYAAAGVAGWAEYETTVNGVTRRSGRPPDIWQFTSTANVDGASDSTDCNAFRGSIAGLAAVLTGRTQGGDDMAKIIRVREDGACWVTSGPQRRHIKTAEDLDEAVALWGPWRDVDQARLDAFGVDVDAEPASSLGGSVKVTLTGSGTIDVTPATP
jgi:hypothetical protein